MEREDWTCWHKSGDDCRACEWLKKMSVEEYDAIWLEFDRQMMDRFQGGDE